MKLNSKILIIHVLVGCLLLFIAGYYTNVNIRKEKFQSIYDGFIDQLYQIDFTISNFLLGVEYDVKNLVENALVRTREDQQFTNFLEADEKTFEYHIGEIEQTIIDVFNTYRLTHPYANSVYMGRENGGFVRSHKRNRPTRYDPRERPWYQLALSDPEKVMRTAPYRSVTTPDVNIGTVKALIDEQGQVYGVVGIDTTLRNLTDYISNIQVGENSDIVLLDDNGIVLTGRDEHVRFKTYDEAGLEYFQAVMEHSQGYLSFKQEGTENYVFYYTSPALGWKICVIVPVQDIDRQVSQFANRMLWIFGCSLLLLSVLTAVGVRKFVIAPIKDLEQNTRQIIQTGDLDHRIDVKTGDEIGQLATSFHEMMTSIKKAQEKLQESEEKYRTLVENINLGVFRTAPEAGGRLLHANSAALTMLGYESLAEFTDIPVESLYEDPKDRRKIIARLAQGETIKHHETRLKKKDGTSIWVSASVTAQRDRNGNIQWLEGVIEDITALKQAEEALRCAHDELEIRVAQRTEELSTANAHLKEEIAERKRAEQALQTANQAALEAKNAADKARQIAEAAQRASEAANRAKSTFLANMSHELRTPLNAILGFSQLMVNSPNLAPEQQENLETISRSGEHLLTLINQVLDLSKIEAGRITLDENSFDLYRLLDDVVELFRLRAQSKNLQLLFERLPDLPQYVRTDKLKLRQVLINLLNNALKFTQDGGIAVRVSRKQKAESGKQTEHIGEESDTAYCLLPTAYLSFEVEDTGPGIASDELATLFEAFTQTAAGRDTTEGTGLGLTISQKFVHLMGGDITVKSEVGHGTMFAFEIAVNIVEAAEVIRQQTTRRVLAIEPGQPRYRLLIVDDAPDNRKLLVRLLNPFNFELREAKNGQEAVEIWEAWHPHLIWMDMRMPVMDGHAATRRIRAVEAARAEEQKSRRADNLKLTINNQQSTIIIAVTASSFEEQRTEVLAAGCDDFLRKPFRTIEIFEMMHNHLGLRFVYENVGARGPVPLPGAQSTVPLLTPETLAALPEELRLELQAGIESINLAVMSRVIEQIRRQNAPLAETLSELVKNYRFDLLQNWIESVEVETGR